MMGKKVPGRAVEFLQQDGKKREDGGETLMVLFWTPTPFTGQGDPCLLNVKKNLGRCLKLSNS